jgi:alcohol dehydrogenase class IV
MNYPFNITSYETHTRIILGYNSIKILTEEVKKFQPKKVMIMSGRHVKKTDFYKKCIEYVKQSGSQYIIFDGVLPEAPVSVIMKACELIKNENCDLLIAIGGGSCIDTAKATGVVATNGGKPQDYAGYEQFKISPIPLIAIPTTAGTSSEVTSMAVINDEENHVKFTVGHKELECPKIAILDPQSLESCPPKVVAEAGIDAFTHSFESYISLKANPHTEALSLQGIRLISENLRAFYTNRKNIIAATNMLAGSTMGGMAFTTTGTGNIHCIGRHIGPRFNLSHGFSNAIVLPSVARFNHPACPEKFVKIAQAMGEDIQGLSLYEAGWKAIKAIEKLCHDVNMLGKLKDYGCTENDFEPLAEDCWKVYQRHYQYINPRQTTKDDFISIIRNSYE